ncbi:sensor histidine kinase [Streptomyces qinzhouensis]|uniref:histidine kinase n=1 Tax=Streptomyces qinzhouensis TaxID=2599401 RepID=A0A5B8IEE7_9ACTN|nr:histidine kinase [Streptomyces qinzhouensis]QDY76472.1 two-component sensor histidine kinase [Streptomyces qinzhouensis]
MDDGESRPLVVKRLRERHWRAVDAAAALLLALAFGAGGTVEDGWAAGAAAAAVWLPVAVRRRWPVPVLYSVLGGAVCAMLLTGWEDAWVVVGAALYTVAAREARRGASVALAVSLVSVAAAGAVVSGPTTAAGTVSGVVFASLVLVLPWLVGTASREQRLHAELAARQAVVDERLRIARELHDVVAHHLTVITVRAEIARAVSATNPREAGETLALVGTAGRAALAEMRRMVGVLRAPSDQDGPGSVPDAAPVPGLAGLPALVAGAGPRVELCVDRDAALPPLLGPAVYRIVQEALTNVVRHADSADCRVTLRRAGPGGVPGGDAVEVEIVNGPPPRRDGPAAAPERRVGGGHGLAGMRERAAAHGGVVSAGPLAGGGFRVHVLLPRGPGRSR